VSLASGETRNVEVTIEVEDCLKDGRRIGADEFPTDCALVIELRLLGEGGSLLDDEVYEAPPTPPGETVTMPPVTLAAPTVVLDPATVAFEAVIGGTTPDARVVTITNGGGGTLADMATSITPAGASEWLSATRNAAGEIVVQPTTTELDAGVHSASVIVAAALASNSPQSIAVTYIVSARPPRVLTIGGANTGSGTVRSNPGGIECAIAAGMASGACTVEFAHGTRVTLEAAAAEGSTFGGFTGDCTSEATCAVTLDEARNVTASFGTVRHTLTVSSGGGGGSGSVSAIGVSCAIGGGSTTGDCSEPFDFGTVVTLTATASADHAFIGWSGGGCSGTGQCTVAMTAARAVTASFAGPLTLAVGGTATGTGTIRSDPEGIECTITPTGSTGTCSRGFARNAVVALTATPGANSAFGGWTGACSGTGGCQVTMTQPVAAFASFPLVTHQLTVNGGGTGTGRVTSTAGIDCTITNGLPTGDCGRLLDHGMAITLRAEVSSRHLFAGWSGACSGTGECIVAMTAARAVTASFVAPLALTVTGTGTGAGTVSSDPNGIACVLTAGSPTGTCSATFVANSVVRLTAAAGGTSTFAGWGGACSGTEPCEVTMSQVRAVTATFSAPFTLTISGTGNGSGSVASTNLTGINCGIAAGAVSGSCTQSFPPNTMVTLTASANESSTFEGWSGACTGTGECRVTMAEAKAVTATFSLEMRRLTVNGSGTGDGTVRSSPSGIDCRISAGIASGVCHFDFAHGTGVTLTPTADASSHSSGWTGACSASGGLCSVTMVEPLSTTAHFTIKEHRIAITLSGGGSGSVMMDVSEAPCRITDGEMSGSCALTVRHGTVVTLTATATPGSAFVGWGGACAGMIGLACAVTVDSPLNVSATIGALYDLDVSGAGMGVGTITSKPAGISCLVHPEGSSGTCSAAFVEATVVTVTATAEEGSLFSGWQGACEGSGTCQITIGGDEEVTAIFDLPPQIQIYGSGTGSGRVVSAPSGINCTITAGVFGSGCHSLFGSNTEVTLAATADPGSAFTRWSECGESSGPGPCIITVTGPNWVTAHFEKLVPLTMALDGSGAGTVRSLPAGIDCTRGVTGALSGTCEALFASGTTITLTATAGATSIFSGFTGCNVTTTPCKVVMGGTTPRAVTATFTATQFALIVAGAGTGSGTVRSAVGTIVCDISSGVATGVCSNLYATGATVRLDPFATANSTFNGWTGACTNVTGSCTVTMSQARNVTARFDIIMLPLTVDPAPTNTGNGTVTSNPAGINCTIAGTTKSGTCSLSVSIGSSLTLTSAAAAGHAFSGWGNACSGTGSCTVSMTTGARTVTAAFSPSPYTVTVNGVGDGTGRVQSQPELSPAIDCTSTRGIETGTCNATYPAGTRVELRATATGGSGHRFTGWGDACIGSAQPCVPPSTPGTSATVLTFFDFDPCAYRVPYSVGQTYTDRIDEDDCQIGTGIYQMSHDVVLPSYRAFQATLDPSGPAEFRVGFNSSSESGYDWYVRSSGNAVAIWVLAPAGQTTLRAVNQVSDDRVSYTLSSTDHTADHCDLIVRTDLGVIRAPRNLQSGDCNYLPHGRTVSGRGDLLNIAASGRMRITARSTGSTFYPQIDVRQWVRDGAHDGAVLESTVDHPGGSLAVLEMAVSGLMQIWISARPEGGAPGGTYEISIEAIDEVSPTSSAPGALRESLGSTLQGAALLRASGTVTTIPDPDSTSGSDISVAPPAEAMIRADTGSGLPPITQPFDSTTRTTASLVAVVPSFLALIRKRPPAMVARTRTLDRARHQSATSAAVASHTVVSAATARATRATIGTYSGRANNCE
jgi:hypothetical protein